MCDGSFGQSISFDINGMRCFPSIVETQTEWASFCLSHSQAKQTSDWTLEREKEREKERERDDQSY